VKNIAQTRDIFLDASHRVNVSAERYNDVRYDTLREIETIMAEPSDRGLSSTFDAFWSAWGDLANDPLNQASRTVVRQRGEQLAMHFNTLTTALDRLRDSTVQRLDATLQSVNTLATQIADLNERIVAAEAGGQTAGHLRDTRDLALDKLAELVPVQIIERANGSVAASVDGLNLVDGADHGSLQASFAGGSWSIRTASGAAAAVSGGAAGAHLSLLNHDLPRLQGELDTIAGATINAVNAAHRQGTNPLGTTDIAFFDDTPPLGARNIRLSSAVDADPLAISAGRGVDANGLPFYRAGAQDIALEIAQLRLAPDAALGMSIGERYDRAVSELASVTRTALDASQAQHALAQHSAGLRDSVMGVSTDEEMVELIRLQNAFAAAARVITVADEMMRTVIEMKR
jgi:flagellar hook-associated protein 1 FlgK